MESKNILFVDDDRFIQKIFKDRLIAEGFSITISETIKDAMEKISSDGYDIIILDYVFAGITGIDLLKWIKKKHVKIPIIVLSALGQEKDIQEAINAGASMYLTKDKTTPNELIKKINELTKNSE